jgi:hypothetical protein
MRVPSTSYIGLDRSRFKCPSHSVLQPFTKCFPRLRSRIKKPLRHIASFGLQESLLCIRLYTFRHHAQLQAMRHCNRRSRQRGIARVVGDVARQRTVFAIPHP